MRDALERYGDPSGRLDEALLSNAFAMIKKCSEDGMDGMAQLLQKVLQLYAGRALRSAEDTGVEGALNQVGLQGACNHVGGVVGGSRGHGG